MVKLVVIVFHSGQWDEQQSYVDYKTNCVLVDGVISSFDSFVNLIRTEIQVESCIELSVLLPIGSNGVQHVLKIVENKDVAWFLTLIKDQSTQYPLVAHSVDIVLDVSIGSSSSSIVEVDLGDELAIFRNVDITNSKAVKNNFEFKTLRSNSKSIELRCNEDGCLWFVRASRYKRSELWMIRKYFTDIPIMKYTYCMMFIYYI
uniref:Transposase MuDR plant domain-containing protein n=1 Tax=Cucumis melo TaxID=3656 RepID=A0A9I9EM97_CUCME